MVRSRFSGFNYGGSMAGHYNPCLLVGAVLSALAALLHLGVIAGGAPWYRFFGAGKRFVAAAAVGRRWQDVVTLCIATVLALWSAYALSGAGIIGPLPMLRTTLVAITTVYMVRALAPLPLLLLAPGRMTPFLAWSSLVCLGYGAVHLCGLLQVWPQL
jgi:hypothetical protein